MKILEKLASLKAYLTASNIAYTLILSLLAKSLIVAPSIEVALIMVPVLGYEGYKMFLKSKTPDPVRINAEVQKDLDQLKSKLSALSMRDSVAEPKKRYF